MAAHAIGEEARALSEGTSYEPKPPILHWAGSNPGTLQIGGCPAADGRGEAEAQKLTFPDPDHTLCPGVHLSYSASVPTRPSH